MKNSVTSSYRKTPATKGIVVQLPQRLYQRVEQTAQRTGYGIKELVVATLETGLPSLPESLPTELAAALARLSLLNDEALTAIANAFLPAKQQRRYSTLLRKSLAQRLNAHEEAEWNELQQEYLRFSENKAHAVFLLAQRKQTGVRLTGVQV